MVFGFRSGTGKIDLTACLVGFIDMLAKKDSRLTEIGSLTRGSTEVMDSGIDVSRLQSRRLTTNDNIICKQQGVDRV